LIKVLHVDDDPYHLKFGKILLEQIDPEIEVTSITEPREALEMLEEGFDCIVSDYQMPIMDGIQLAEKVKEESSLPFLIYTGRGSEEVAEAAFSVGVDDYIRKEHNPSHYQVLAKRIRQAVEKSRIEFLYKGVAESALDALSIKVNTTTVFANQALANLVGVKSPEDLIGRDTLEWVTPEHRELIRDRAAKLQSGKMAPSPIQYALMRMDGERRYVETNASLINFHGTPASLVFTRDITEQKKLEDELIQSKENYRSVVENSDQAIAIMRDGVFKYVNPKASEITGYTQSELLASSLGDLIHPDDYQMVRVNNVKRLNGSLYPRIYPFRLVMKDGSIRWVEVNAAQINWDGERAWLNFLTDITRRKRYEELLRDSEERFRLIFEHAPDAMYLNDLQGNFVDGNRAAEEITGYTREELIGKNMFEVNLLSPELASRASELLEKNLDGYATGPEEFRIRRKTGELLWVEISAYPVKIRDETLVLGIARDNIPAQGVGGEPPTIQAQMEVTLRTSPRRHRHPRHEGSLEIRQQSLRDENGLFSGRGNGEAFLRYLPAGRRWGYKFHGNASLHRRGRDPPLLRHQVHP